MNKIPSIASLHAERGAKEQSKTEIFTVVLNKCIEKILYTNRHTDQTFVIFEVPKILIGYPSYDMKSCILFLINRLSQNGYLIDFVDPFYLYIDWGSVRSSSSSTCSSKKLMNIIPSVSNPTKLEKQTKVLLEKYPETSKIEFVYADTLASSSKKRKKNKKNK
jgi:hypothetical protein